MLREKRLHRGNEVEKTQWRAYVTPGIARFLSVDPLTKSFPWYTPYQFAGNKPIMAIDLDGLEEWVVINYYNSEEEIVNSELIEVNSEEAKEFANDLYSMYQGGVDQNYTMGTPDHSSDFDEYANSKVRPQKGVLTINMHTDKNGTETIGNISYEKEATYGFVLKSVDFGGFIEGEWTIGPQLGAAILGDGLAIGHSQQLLKASVSEFAPDSPVTEVTGEFAGGEQINKTYVDYAPYSMVVERTGDNETEVEVATSYLFYHWKSSTNGSTKTTFEGGHLSGDFRVIFGIEGEWFMGTKREYEFEKTTYSVLEEQEEFE